MHFGWVMSDASLGNCIGLYPLIQVEVWTNRCVFIMLEIAAAFDDMIANAKKEHREKALQNKIRAQEILERLQETTVITDCNKADLSDNTSSGSRDHQAMVAAADEDDHEQLVPPLETCNILQENNSLTDMTNNIITTRSADQISTAKKRGASNLNSCNEAQSEESPPKLLKAASTGTVPEQAADDQMEVETSPMVSLAAARDFMDLDCGNADDHPQSCPVDSSDEQQILECPFLTGGGCGGIIDLIAEQSSTIAVLQSNVEQQIFCIEESALGTLQDVPDDVELGNGSNDVCCNYSSPAAAARPGRRSEEAAEETRNVWAEKERDFKRDLQERVLRKAAADAEETLESARKRLTINTHHPHGILQQQQSCLQQQPQLQLHAGTTADDPDRAAADDHEQLQVVDEASFNNHMQAARPIIWGTTIYRDLWSKAATIDDDVVEEDQEVQQQEEVEEDNNMIQVDVMTPTSSSASPAISIPEDVTLESDHTFVEMSHQMMETAWS